VRFSIPINILVFSHQEVWACWCELLSYLDAENKWLNEIELKLKATENIQGGAEEISESLDVSTDLNNIESHVMINCKSHYIQKKNYEPTLHMSKMQNIWKVLCFHLIQQMRY